MSWEARMERNRQNRMKESAAAEEEAERKRWEAAHLKMVKRESILADERFKAMREAANSPELREALEYIGKQKTETDPGLLPATRIEITEEVYESPNHPVGRIFTTLYFDRMAWNESTDSRDKVEVAFELQILFTWRDAPEPERWESTGRGSRSLESEAKPAGLCIEVPKDEYERKFSTAFQTLQSLEDALDFLASKCGISTSYHFGERFYCPGIRREERVRGDDNYKG